LDMKEKKLGISLMIMVENHTEIGVWHYWKCVKPSWNTNRIKSWTSEKKWIENGKRS
jgi:hypothetical protein